MLGKPDEFRVAQLIFCDEKDFDIYAGPDRPDGRACP